MSKEINISEFLILFKEAVEQHKSSNEPLPEISNFHINKLESCLSTPFQNVFGKELYPTISEKAAILMYLLIKNHPLANGNKRMALMATAFYLAKNDLELKISDDQAYNLTKKVATSDPADKDKIIELIKNTLTPPAMKAEEIKAKIEKIKTMPGLTDKTRAEMLAAWENKLGSVEKPSSPVKEESEEVEEEDLFEHPDKVPVKVQNILDKLDGSLNYDRIQKLKKRVEALGYTFDSGMDNEPYNLRKINKGTESKENPAGIGEPKAKAGRPRKPGSKKVYLAKTKKYTYKFKGKELPALDDKDCADLIKETKERRQKAAKSEKKSKSRPIIEKVVTPIVKSVKKAIENIPAADLKDDSGKELTRVDKAIAATKKYIMELKTILGEDFDKDTVDDEMKELHTLSKELHKKYGE